MGGKKLNMTLLLAKSKRVGKEPLSLQQHLTDTEKAAGEVFRLDRRWGQKWCGFFGIQGPEAQERFLLNLCVAALLHDVGKANEDFQAAVTRGNIIQTIRHEHLSALLMHVPNVRAWLAANPRLDLEVVTAAVLSHHIKAARGGEWKWCRPQTLKQTVRLSLQHDEVKTTFERIREIANLGAVPKLPSGPFSAHASWVQQAWQGGIDAADKFGPEVSRDRERRALLLAVKTGLIVADAVASGLVREGHPISEWIEAVAHAPALGYNEINDDVISPRIKQIEKTKPFKLRVFQEQTATLGPRALLLSACGSGKTMAAWKWAEAQSREREIGRVIFLYPTRGTATEGFRDYVGWAPEAKAALVHGTSRYELEAMQANPSEATTGKNHGLSQEEDKRLFALGLWSRRFFSATVDQFISFMEHNYGGLCLLPALADSAVIIDEVHSFDKRMFNSLLSFLRAFDVPVLCMTATLSQSRIDELKDSGLKVFPTTDEMATLEDLEREETHLRYHLAVLSGESEALERAVEAYRNGERVLWVVNTVGRCQHIACQLEKRLGEKVLNYHSRYRLLDRQDKHQLTVTAFQQIDHAAIAVTTQVCEMSLDLDADVLLTEVAPVTSLVQRFGRANRHCARGDDFRARLFTYAPESALPYTAEELRAAEAFLKELGGGDVSQRMLTEKLELHAPPEPLTDGSARLLDSGYFATPGVFRDADERNAPCVLDSDLKEVERLLKIGRPYDQFIVGVPRRWVNGEEARPDWLPRYLNVASANFYSADYGFKTEE
jgi:CRISPR-associated endonuclease/helicase Cas3